MTEQPEHPKSSELNSTGYELFILLLSLVSIFNLIVMVGASFISPDANTLEVVGIIDVMLTLFFIFDFCYRILTTSAKSVYFFKRGGWADLVACRPGLRIFRLFRVILAVRQMRTFGLKNMVKEIIDNRADSASSITLFAVITLAEAAAYQSLISKVIPRQNLGTFSGLIQSSVGFVSLPAPWIGAQLWERYNPRLPFMITAGLALLSVIPVWFKFKVPEGPAGEAAPEAAEAGLTVQATRDA